jgi:Tfp pilus assembly protein PilN
VCSSDLRNISRKTKLAENNLATVSKTIENKSWHNWGKLLTELADITPQTVLIKNLRTENDNTVRIDGLAVSFEAVNSFVGLLEQSSQISSASLSSAGQETKSGNGLIDYSITCSLTVKE